MSYRLSRNIHPYKIINDIQSALDSLDYNSVSGLDSYLRAYLSGYIYTSGALSAGMALIYSGTEWYLSGVSNWDQAYRWGDHSSAGYISGVQWGDITGTLGSQYDLQAALDTKGSFTDVALNTAHRNTITGNPHNVTLSEVGGTLDHTLLTNIGSNTHNDIDNHISDAANPHSVTCAQIGAIENNDNAVKDNHIDWGTGAMQISADSIPIEDAGGYYANTEVESALQEIYPIASSAYSGIGIDNLGMTVNLNNTNPDYQVDVSGDYLQVERYNISNINLTVDITLSGVNGLDIDSESPDTWYAIHVIYNPMSDTVSGLLSESHTSPTLPDGYTAFRHVGWVRNDSGSNFLTCPDCIFDETHERCGDPSGFDITEASLTRDSAWHTGLSFAEWVPPGAKRIHIKTVLEHNGTNLTLSLKKNGQSNNYKNASAKIYVANVPHELEIHPLCDSNRECAYYATNTLSSIGLLVVGWDY